MNYFYKYLALYNNGTHPYKNYAQLFVPRNSESQELSADTIIF